MFFMLSNISLLKLLDPNACHNWGLTSVVKIFLMCHVLFLLLIGRIHLLIFLVNDLNPLNV